MANVCTLKETKYEGFDTFVLGNGRIQMCIVPELGGKITSIQDLDTQREWLWRNPHLPNQPVVYGASFVKKYDTGGLDECFPSVAGGAYPDAPWDGVMIPDHGELWCQPWDIEVVESSAEQIVLALGCNGVRFPYRFERTLTFSADSPAITLDYRVSNLTSFDMPFVWSIHPILKIEAGMQVKLPTGVEMVRSDFGADGFLGKGGSLHSWPQAKSDNNQLID